MRMSPSETEDLRLAKCLLENPGLAAKISDVVGAPIEKGLNLLPKRWNSVVIEATRKSIQKALDVALWTMDHEQSQGARSNWWHKLAVGTSGAVGGAFGMPALAVELPIATTIILRSIADIGRGEGEDIRTADFKVECVHVLALGGHSDKDDAAEVGYFAARAAMATAVSEAIRHIAEKGISQQGAPAIVRLIAMVASRFSINVTEKAAAQAVPIVGSIGGALVNTVFLGHFQDIARGHFIVRRLERAHGSDEIERAYAALDVGS